MPTHGCIRCSRCGGACPLCGTCACTPEQLKAASKLTYVVPGHDFLQAFRPAVEEDVLEDDEDQRPETD